MYNISFDFDPETEKVSGLVVSKKGAVQSAPKTTKIKSTDKITLNGASLKINQDVLDLLKVNIGDRVSVRFNPGPILVRPDISGEINGGNLITKSLTIAVRGKTGEAVAKYGTEFGYVLESDGFLKLTSDSISVQPQLFPSEIEETDDVVLSLDKPQEEKIDNVLLDELDFTAPIEGGVEVDFDFNI